jgi:hypothetical protein
VSSLHVRNFATALQLHRRLDPIGVLRIIRIFTIAINADYSFGESISAPVQAAAWKLVESIVSELDQ